MFGKIYINGEWKQADEGTIDVVNPANGEVVGETANAGEAETKEAINAAHEAFDSWSKTTAYERADILRKIHGLMMDRQDELGELLTKEMGKPLAEAKGEVAYAASFIEWYADEAKRVYGETIPSGSENKRLMVIHQPVGVVGAITPWNFPQAMITRKVGPALAAGCTIVLKPAKNTPLSAVRFVEICEEAGVPKGVINLVTGQSSSAIGNELMSNEKVRKVTFTGSTEVGSSLMEQGAQDIKKLSLELGGHAPALVLDDADIDKAVKGVVASKFRASGQTCICVNRVYADEKVYEEFVEKFADACKDLKVGDGMDENVKVGPLIDKDAYDKVERHVQDAVDKGAKVVTGGSGFEKDGGYYFEPTVLRDVNHDMIIMHEETFGPVAPVQKITSDEEGVKLANTTPFGLASYFFTENMSRGMKVAEGLEYGIVGWNDGGPSAAQAPFGGWKQSGVGREGGRQGIMPFLETKYISMGL
jgi:succinate-semialdehyde dehydrogenase/glutarate-semialdehyde dehydrogenase